METKKLSLEEMEKLNGGDWGLVACHVGISLVGLALMGPAGLKVGMFTRFMLCGALKAH